MTVALKVKQKLSVWVPNAFSLATRYFLEFLGMLAIWHLENMGAKEVEYTQSVPLDGRREILAPAGLLPSSLKRLRRHSVANMACSPHLDF